MKFTALNLRTFLFESQKFFDRTAETGTLFRKETYPVTNLFIDPATNTGMAIFTQDGELVAGFRAEIMGDDKIQYRRDLYNVISELHKKFNFGNIYFEEVFVGKSFDTLKVLLSIRQTFFEIEKDLGIRALGVNNKRWKAALGRKIYEDDKENIRHHVSQTFDINNIPQDTIDAIGMGMAVLRRNAMVVTLPPKSAFKYYLYLVEEPEDVTEIILKNHKKLFQEHGFNFFSYNTTELFKPNALHALAYDNFTCALIPPHRYFPQILLQNGIREMDTRDKKLLVVFHRK
ncbi:hypothetical protein ABGV42_01975 [Paenibacillus pabuli]|uniref:hypothetical protein n=1 Tax=Paenibacillus pabuli TaxID=1472 RepID=UPI003242E816